MSRAGIGLEPGHLGEVFPFHLAFDRQLRIYQLGRAWARLVPELAPGADFAVHFRIQRPPLPAEFDAIAQQVRSLFVLECRASGLLLRGEMLRLEAPEVLLFLGSPWVTDLADLGRFQLSLSDLALHEPTSDLLFLLQTKNSALADAKRLAAQVSLQEAHLRAVVDSAVEGIITADESGRIQSFNAAAARIFGYEVGEVLGQNLSMLMPAEDGDRHDDYIARYLEGGEPHVIGRGRQVEGARKDGSRFPLFLAVSEVASGDKRTFVGVLRDLTEQQQAAAALRESERRFRNIVDNALDAVITIDAAGRVLVWNSQAEEIFGWSAAQMLGNELAEWIVPEDLRQAHRDGLARAVVTGTGPVLNRRVEIEGLHRDGHRFPIELSVTPLSSGEEPHFSAFVRDITERKRVEAELHAAKEAAEVANEAKSRFLAIMSHEIRTPLNPIIGLTGLLLDMELGETQQKFVRQIRDSGMLLLQRINDILDFSRIEAGRIELESVDFDLRQSVQQVRELFQHEAEDKRLQLVLEIATDAPHFVRGDPGRLQQVFTNLVANALKFTERGVVRLIVGGAQAIDSRLCVRFEVVDTGIGIASDRVANLFDPFTQADASTTRRYGGSGLGLAIAKELVSLMGGEIGVESQPGGGTRFWFTVRFSLAESVQPAPRLADLAPRGPHSGEAASLRVLVAEDNPTNQEVAVLMLERLGHRVDVVGDGREAVAAFARAPYDVILMDCQMPEVDGFEATRQIRALGGRGAEVPIVAMTAFAARGDRERCLAAGMTGYVSKPILKQELGAALAPYTAALTGAPPIDGAVFDKLRALETPDAAGAVTRMVRAFVAGTPQRLVALDAALAAAEWARAEVVLIEWKSEANVFGAGRLAALCDRAVDAFRRREADGAARLVAELRTEAAAVDAALQAFAGVA